jgi:hypothetical protein
VLEDCTTEEQRSLVRFFLWAKKLNIEVIHKEMFPVYGGKCLSRLFGPFKIKNHLGGIRFADDERIETEVQKWLRQQ